MDKFTGLLDMFDGGGMGASGDTFKGGLLSELLNGLGVRPRGYEDRQQQMGQVRPQMRPQSPQQSSQVSSQSPQSPQPMQYGPQNGRGGPRGMSLPNDPSMPQMDGFAFGPNNSGPMAQPMPSETPTPAPLGSGGGLGFQEFVSGLGPAAQGATMDQLMQAYQQHMARYNGS